MFCMAYQRGNLEPPEAEENVPHPRRARFPLPSGRRPINERSPNRPREKPRYSLLSFLLAREWAY
jgi:hypothetical protein